MKKFLDLLDGCWRGDGEGCGTEVMDRLGSNFNDKA